MFKSRKDCKNPARLEGKTTSIISLWSSDFNCKSYNARIKWNSVQATVKINFQITSLILYCLQYIIHILKNPVICNSKGLYFVLITKLYILESNSRQKYHNIRCDHHRNECIVTDELYTKTNPPFVILPCLT